MSTLLSFQDQDPDVISKGMNVANTLTPEQISQLALKAKTNSPYAQKRFSEERDADILSFIQANPGATTKEIQDAISRQGRSLSYRGLMTILTEVRNRKVVRGDAPKSGQFIKWYVSSEDSAEGKET